MTQRFGVEGACGRRVSYVAQGIGSGDESCTVEQKSQVVPVAASDGGI
ncbi:MAG: hypothetical protein ACT4TC_07860 [Myxococcaceae bacterium]